MFDVFCHGCLRMDLVVGFSKFNLLLFKKTKHGGIMNANSNVIILLNLGFVLQLI